jgi:hypothetical protein
MDTETENNSMRFEMDDLQEISVEPDQEGEQAELEIIESDEEMGNEDGYGVNVIESNGPTNKTQDINKTVFDSSNDDDEEDENLNSGKKIPSNSTTIVNVSSGSTLSRVSSNDSQLQQLRAFSMSSSTIQEEEDDAPILYSDDEENNADIAYRNKFKQIKNQIIEDQQKRKKRRMSATPATPESPVPKPDAKTAKKTLIELTPDTILYSFVKSCCSEESLRRELIRDYENPHWSGIRAKYNMERSARKGRWSESEINLIKKYGDLIKNYKSAVNASITGEGLQPEDGRHVVNVSHVKHFISLIIGRGYDSFEIQWGKVIIATPGENFCDNIRILKEIFDKELNVDQNTERGNKGLQQRSQEDDVASLYQQLTVHMKMYQQCVMDYRKGKKQGELSNNGLTFRELSQLVTQYLDKVNSYHTLYNEQLHEHLWRCTFNTEASK